jgi:iron complex transport system substrate-binding protein
MSQLPCSRGDAELGETRMNEDRPLDQVSADVIDVAYKIHTALGPGLLESAYESLLARSLTARGLRIERQKLVSFEFEGLRISEGLKVDILVDERLVVEIKSVESLLPVHTKQVLTYLRAMDLRVGLLINFGGATLKDGLRRVVNGYRPSHFGARLETRSPAKSRT